MYKLAVFGSRSLNAAPSVWLDEPRSADWPLIPFSDGPAFYPGRNLALMLTSMMLATLIADREAELRRPKRFGPDKPMPGTLNHYGLRFRLNA